MTDKAKTYGETMRLILEVPILKGLPTEMITDADRASAAEAAVSLLRHNSPRKGDVNEFTVASVGIFTDCDQCGRQHKVKPFRGKVADAICNAAKGGYREAPPVTMVIDQAQRPSIAEITRSVAKSKGLRVVEGD